MPATHVPPAACCLHATPALLCPGHGQPLYRRMRASRRSYAAMCPPTTSTWAIYSSLKKRTSSETTCRVRCLLPAGGAWRQPRDGAQGSALAACLAKLACASALQAATALPRPALCNGNAALLPFRGPCSARGAGDSGQRGHGGAQQDSGALAAAQAMTTARRTAPCWGPCTVTFTHTSRPLNRIKWERSNGIDQYNRMENIVYIQQAWAGGAGSGASLGHLLALAPSRPRVGVQPPRPLFIRCPAGAQFRSKSRSTCLRLMRWSSNTRSCGARMRLYLRQVVVAVAMGWVQAE